MLALIPTNRIAAYVPSPYIDMPPDPCPACKAARAEARSNLGRAEAAEGRARNWWIGVLILLVAHVALFALQLAR